MQARWLAAALVLVTMSAAGAQPGPFQPAPAARSMTPAVLAGKLTERIQISTPVQATLQKCAEWLGEATGTTIQLDQRAFKSADPPIEDVASQEIQLPAMHGVRLEAVFQHMLKPLGGTVVIRSDHFEITTPSQARSDFGWGPLFDPGNSAEDDETVVVRSWKYRSYPLTHVVARGQRLSDLVEDLADRYPEHHIQLMPQAGRRRADPITATLVNTPLNTALRRLAEAADLRLAELHDGLVITTRERAAALIADETEREWSIVRSAIWTQWRAYPQLVAQPAAVQSPRESRPKAISWDDYARRVRAGQGTAGRRQ